VRFILIIGTGYDSSWSNRLKPISIECVGLEEVVPWGLHHTQWIIAPFLSGAISEFSYIPVTSFFNHQGRLPKAYEYLLDGHGRWSLCIRRTGTGLLAAERRPLSKTQSKTLRKGWPIVTKCRGAYGWHVLFNRDAEQYTWKSCSGEFSTLLLVRLMQHKKEVGVALVLTCRHNCVTLCHSSFRYRRKPLWYASI